jgi:hypothetical protein
MATYKGYTFNEKKFSEFLSNKIVEPLLQKIPEATGVRVLYDDKETASNLFVLFELPEEKQKTFQVRLSKVLGACYATCNPKRASDEDKECVTFIEEKVKEFA